MDDFVEMKLSDSFELAQDFPNLDLVVKAYNINKGRNAELAARSLSLSGYGEFVAAVRENQKAMSLKEAVRVAIRSCVSKNILAEFLTEHGSEVENMLFHKWNWDEAKSVWQEEAEERGRKKILDLMRKGLSLAEIEKTLNLQKD